MHDDDVVVVVPRRRRPSGDSEETTPRVSLSLRRRVCLYVPKNIGMSVRGTLTNMFYQRLINFVVFFRPNAKNSYIFKGKKRQGRKKSGKQASVATELIQIYKVLDKKGNRDSAI